MVSQLNFLHQNAHRKKTIIECANIILGTYLTKELIREVLVFSFLKLLAAPPIFDVKKKCVILYIEELFYAKCINLFFYKKITLNTKVI